MRRSLLLTGAALALSAADVYSGNRWRYVAPLSNPATKPGQGRWRHDPDARKQKLARKARKITRQRSAR